MDNLDYRSFLRAEFDQRRASNKSYSLRALARDLELSPSMLSEVMSKKHGLSRKKATVVSKNLKHNQLEMEYFLMLVELEQLKDHHKKEQLIEKINSFESDHKLELGYFECIKNWYYMAILELFSLRDFKNDSSWMASKLGVDQVKVEEAIEQLLEVGFLVLEGEKLLPSTPTIPNGEEVSSTVTRYFHNELLTKSIAAIEQVDVTKREISHNLVAVNDDELEEFKLDILKWHREMCLKYGSGANKTSVYSLGVQLVPLTKGILQ